MILPAPLEPGARIAIVAPASGCSREELDRGVAELARLGFEATCTDAIFERTMFSAGRADVRAADFLRAWQDPSVSALVALRGGYGSAEILPRLSPAALARTPKLFIGYSDNTSVLSWLTSICGITCLHGPMIERRLAAGAQGYDESSFLAFVRGGAGTVLEPDGVEVLRHGDAGGPLFGGTLTQLTASLGTPFAFNPPDGSVLFIEDVNERPYRLHRMLTQLKLAGVLARARAVVFGEMRACDEPAGAPSARDAVLAALAPFDGPVLFGFPSGHTAGPCWTLPLGVAVRVETTPRARVIVEDAPVG